MVTDRIGIALVGTGGMARRYLQGLKVLSQSGYENVGLTAIVGRSAERTALLADEAAAILGTRPSVCSHLADLIATPDVDGAVVVTDSGSHHVVAVNCLEASLHVMIEKPLALTVRGCTRVIETAQRLGRVLSVAENYRRDPINRLAAALIAEGAIGTPRMMIESRIGGGNELFITPWRHQKFSGSVVLDTGVHNADILQYYLGPAHLVFGEGFLYEPLRYRVTSNVQPGTYANWTDFYRLDAEAASTAVEATGEDALFAHIRFANGAVGQWTFNYAAHGPADYRRIVYGSEGTLICPGDRNGRPITFHLGAGREVTGEDILPFAAGYHLDPLTARLFGGERPWHYQASFAEADAKLLAIELHEFGRCVLDGAIPEVDGATGRRDVALVNAVLESGRAGRAVTLAEVEAGAVDGYQREIDQHFGLI